MDISRGGCGHFQGWVWTFPGVGVDISMGGGHLVDIWWKCTPNVHSIVLAISSLFEHVLIVASFVKLCLGFCLQRNHIGKQIWVVIDIYLDFSLAPQTGFLRNKSFWTVSNCMDSSNLFTPHLWQQAERKKTIKEHHIFCTKLARTNMKFVQNWSS